MNIDVLQPTIVHLHTTTCCTLRCKYCGWKYPYFKGVEDQDNQLVCDSIDMLFWVFEHIKEFRIEGGEAFLYPGVEKILVAAAKYKGSFDTLSMVTNGSYIPKARILETIAALDCPMFVRIDEYGDLSKCAKDIVALLQQYGIKYDLRVYDGKDQFSGGWLDFGTLDDKGWSEKELLDVFMRCECGVSKGEYTIWDGRIYGCSRSPVAAKLTSFVVPEGDYVDLFDGTSVEQKRDKVRALYKKPLAICATCYGADRRTGKRIPAAEQLP
jgi:hypothetical protein